MAHLDDLSGLSNSRHLKAGLAGALAKSCRSGQPVSVLFIEVDHFKRINDDLGHRAGDETIRIIGQRLRKHFGKDVLVARYGGDEFVAILKEDKWPALANAELLRKSFEENSMCLPGRHGEVRFPVRIRVGVATYPQDVALGQSTVLELADHASMVAKNLGGNRVCSVREVAGGDELIRAAEKEPIILTKLKDFSTEEILSAAASLSSMVGKEALLTLIKKHPFVYAQTIKTAILTAKCLPDDLPFLRGCQLIEELITKDVFSAAFERQPQATVLSIMRIYETGQEINKGRPEAPNFLYYLEELEISYPGIKELFLDDYPRHPEESVATINFLRINKLDPRPLMQRHGLTYLSDILGLSAEKLPALSGLKGTKPPTAALSGYYSAGALSGERGPRVNIPEHTAREYLKKSNARGEWLMPGAVAWVGLRINAANSCPLECVYCEQDAQKSPVPVSHWTNLLDVLARDEKGGIREGVSLNITGGEPTSYGPQAKYLLELIKHAKRLGMLVSINTSGVLVSEDLALELARAGLDNVNITLNSLQPAVHNAMVRMKNGGDAFSRTLAAIDHFRAARGKMRRPMTITVNTVITNANYEDLPAFAAFVGQNTGADDINPLPVKAAPALYLSGAQVGDFVDRVLPEVRRVSRMYGFFLLPTKAERIFGRTLTEHILAAEGRYHFRPDFLKCFTAATSIYVKYNGAVYYCCYGADHPGHPELQMGTLLTGKEDILSLRSSPEAVARLNHLPCGEVCRDHCGPDLAALQIKTYAAISRRAEKRDLRVRNLIHDFCQGEKIPPPAVVEVLSAYARKEGRPFAEVTAKYVAGTEPERRQLVATAKELFAQTPDLDRRHDYRLRMKVASLGGRYKLDEETIGEVFRFLLIACERRSWKDQTPKILQCLEEILATSTRLGENPLELCRLILARIDSLALTPKRFIRELRQWNLRQQII